MIISILKKTFKFLSSIQLAVIVLIALAYILALGTFQESLYGTEVAKAKVYNTVWFSVVLFFLGVNVFCAAMSRWPWKKHHIGFLVTHLGIIVILLGALVTKLNGVDGSLSLEEGEEGNLVTLNEPIIQVVNPDTGLIGKKDLSFLNQDARLEKPLRYSFKEGSQLHIHQYFRNSSQQLEVKNTNLKSNPALQVALGGMPNSAQETAEWLFLENNQIQNSTLNFGPAKIYFLKYSDYEKLEEQTSFSQASDHAKIQLEFEDAGLIQIPLKQALEQKKISLANTPYTFELIRYLPDARVKNASLVNESMEPKNPAIEFKIHHPNGEQKHILFSLFPDLEGVHGVKNNKIPVKAAFIYPLDEDNSKMKQVLGELYFSVNSQGTVVYKMRRKGLLGEESKLELGKNIQTGWMTIYFRVDQFFAQAETDLSYQFLRVKNPMASSAPPPALEISIEKNGKHSSQTWMSLGDYKQLLVEGEPYLVSYGLRTYPMSFKLKLLQFKVEQYPGTQNPSEYLSIVEVSPPNNGPKFQQQISMNKPLEYEGFKIYQSSFQQIPGQKAVSIFTAALDPGKYIKYFGCFIMVLGICLMFWFKPLFIQKMKLKSQNYED